MTGLSGKPTLILQRPSRLSGYFIGDALPQLPPTLEKKLHQADNEMAQLFFSKKPLLNEPLAKAQFNMQILHLYTGGHGMEDRITDSKFLFDAKLVEFSNEIKNRIFTPEEFRLLANYGYSAHHYPSLIALLESFSTS